MPVDYARYGSNWKKVSRTIRRLAGNRCEFCGIENGALTSRGTRVTLTVAHLGIDYVNSLGSGKLHDKHDVRRENLRSLCNRCHLRLDIDEHVESVRKTRQRKRYEQAMCAGQLEWSEL